jgi:hypothetical protein
VTAQSPATAAAAGTDGRMEMAPQPIGIAQNADENGDITLDIERRPW